MINGDLWLKVMDDNLSKNERNRLLYEMHKNVDVIIDLPAHLYWKELSEVFPEAKVIFFARSEESWVKSSSDQHELVNKLWPWYLSDFLYNNYLKLVAPKTYKKHLWFYEYFNLCQVDFHGFNRGGLTRNLTGLLGFHGQFYNGKYHVNKFLNKMRFRRHNADVLYNCPKEKLLHLKEDTFNWETICKFTKTDVPKDAKTSKVLDFPHANKKGAFINDLMVEDEAPMVVLYRKEVRETLLRWVKMVGFGMVCGMGYYRYRGGTHLRSQLFS